MPLQRSCRRHAGRLGLWFLVVAVLLAAGLPAARAAARAATGIVAAGRFAAPPPPDQQVCLPPAAAKPEAKKTFWRRMSRDLDRSYRAVAMTALAAGLVPEAIVSKGAAGALAVYAAGLYFLSGEANAWAEDPPDKHYTTVAAPVVHLARPLIAGSGLTAAEAGAANALMSNIARVGAYTGAMATATNRATGAADAGSSTWLGRQDGAVRQDATRLANLVRAEPALSARLRQAAADAGLRLTIAPGDLGQTEQSGHYRRVKQTILATLKQLGVAAPNADRSATDILRPTLTSTISFPDVLVDPRIANDAALSASALDQFAAGVCTGTPRQTPTPVPNGNRGDLQQAGPITVGPTDPNPCCKWGISSAGSLSGRVTDDTPFGEATFTWTVPSRIPRTGAQGTLTLTVVAGRAASASNLEVELFVRGEVDGVCASASIDCTHISAYSKGGNTATATSTFTLKARDYSAGRKEPVLVQIGCAWGGPAITIPYRIIQ